MKNLEQAQSFLEFSFALIMVVALMVGMIRVFLWSGSDLVKRRQAHEDVLTNTLACGGSTCVLRQLRHTFFKADDLRATFNSHIY